MDTTTLMSIGEWLQAMALGAFAGATGQAVRLAAGLGKFLDAGVPLDRGRIGVTLLVGAAVGVVAALALGIAGRGVHLATVVSLIGIGYAGTDFIESFMRRDEPPALRGAEPAVVTPPNAVG